MKENTVLYDFFLHKIDPPRVTIYREGTQAWAKEKPTFSSISLKDNPYGIDPEVAEFWVNEVGYHTVDI